MNKITTYLTESLISKIPQYSLRGVGMTVVFLCITKLVYSQEVDKIIRLDPNPTNASSVQFRVTFTGGVPPYGFITKDDFTLTSTVGGSIASVSTYLAFPSVDIQVDGITGNGTIRLDLDDADNSIYDALLSSLTINTFTTGEIYTIDNTAPTFSDVSDDGDGTYRSGETITFDVDLNETGLTVTADLSVLDSDFTNAQILNDDGDGTYSFTTLALNGGGNMAGGNEIVVSFSAQDDAGNTTVNNSLKLLLDKQSPSISAVVNLASDNIYIDLNFSEEIYKNVEGTDPLTTSQLQLNFTKNDGNATNVTLSSLKQPDSPVESSASNLIGGETIIRVFLNMVGVPNGSETIELAPMDNASIYDIAGNPMSGAETTGSVTLNNQCTVSADAGNDDTICMGETITIGGSNTGMGGSGFYSFQWRIPADGPTIIATTANPTVGPGSTTTYEVTVTDSDGCIDTDQVTIIVNPLPVATFSPDSIIFKENASSFRLDDNGQLSPVHTAEMGGVLSGNGITYQAISDKYYFNPALADLGDNIITYTYKDDNGCEVTATENLKVIGSSGSVLNLLTQYCPDFNGGMVSGLQAAPGSVSAGRTFESLRLYKNGVGYISGPLTDDNGDDIYDLDLEALGAGEFSIDVFSTFDAGTPVGAYLDSYSTSQLFSRASDPTISSLAESYCSDASPVTLAGSIPTYTNHIFTASEGVSGDQFDPGNISFVAEQYEKTITITYTYKDTNGCTGAITQDVTIYRVPLAPSVAASTTYCTNDEISYLTVDGVDGAFFSWYKDADVANIANFLDNGTSLNPVDGSEDPIDNSIPGTYNYWVTQTLNGCVSPSAQASLEVYQRSNPQINGLNSAYCVDADPIIFGVEDANSLPLSSAAIKINGSVTATPEFNPSTLGVGTHIVKYTYTNANGCTDSTQMEVKVNPLPTVDFSGFNATMKYCYNDDPITLVGSPAVTTGTVGIFSTNTGGLLNNDGTGIVTFSPALAVQATGADSLGPITTHEITYTFTDANGCMSSKTYTITVSPLPEVNFSGLNVDQAYCYDTEKIILTGYPESSDGFFTGEGIMNHGDGTADFTPNIAAALAGYTSPTDQATKHSITYIYTSTDGCINKISDSVSVNPLPEVSFSGYNTIKSYCYDEEEVILIGEPAESTGIFSGSGLIDNEDGTASFIPYLAAADSGAINPTDFATYHKLTYTYTNSNGCINEASQTLTVKPLPELNFTNLKEAYCLDQEAFILQALPTGGTFSGPGVTGNVFNPSEAGVGTHILRYTYTSSLTSCTNYIEQEVMIRPLPTSDFTFNASCNETTVSLSEISNIEGNDMLDEITAYNWQFGDYSAIETEQQLTHTYARPGTYTVNLNVATAFGCSDSKDTTLYFDAVPNADFIWKNACFRDSTQFISTSTVSLGNISSYVWELGDEKVIDGGIHLKHQYQNPGIYQAKLSITTSNGCADTIAQDIYILPKVTEFPYVEDFETETHGWIVGGVNASWEQGMPTGTTITEAASGEQVWITNVDGVYNPNENSWINSPCFDISSMDNPVLAFKIWYVTDANFDGAVIQTSVDDGQSWEVLGSLEEGVARYNSAAIVGQPGEQDDIALGWTGNSSGWQNAKFSLDHFTNVPCLRFRIAFGSNADNTPGKNFDGFAFDDFRIRERNRIILLEQFTNISSTSFIRVDTEFQKFANTYHDEIIRLQYHTDFPGSDPLNQDNRADPSARTLYYGIAQVPKVIMDGSYKDGELSEWAEPDFQERILDDAPFSIEVNFGNEIENQLNVQVEIQALTDIEAEVTAHIAVIEQEIEASFNGLSERKYFNVLKKMLPNAGGTQLSKNSWTIGETEEISHSWRPENVNDVEQLAVIVFLQDNITKEIYQTTLAQPQETLQITTGLNDPIETNDKGRLRIYPNPTSEQIKVSFEKNSKYHWKISDQWGRMVKSGKSNFTSDFTIDVQSLSNGLYILQVKNNNQENYSARFSVAR